MDKDLDPLVTRKAAAVLLGGVNRSTLHRWQVAGKLPPVLKIWVRVQGWRKSTLMRFLADAGEGAK